MRSPLLPRVAQASYLTWGYLQEKVVTTELPHPQWYNFTLSGTYYS